MRVFFCCLYALQEHDKNLCGISVWLSVCLTHTYIYVYVYIYIYILYIWCDTAPWNILEVPDYLVLTVCLSASVPFCQSAWLPVCLFVQLSAGLPLSVWLSVCLSVCLFLAVNIYGRDLSISSQLMWEQPHLAALCVCLPFPSRIPQPRKHYCKLRAVAHTPCFLISQQAWVSLCFCLLV
jgi:hypothetical protein